MPSSNANGHVSIDGHAPRVVHEPVDAGEVAEILRTAADLDRTVAPLGGRTQLALGNSPDSVDEAIDLRAINRVLHFEPDDLTLSVEAGARFADVQATLAERGQSLPIDVPDAERATIGGLIATAMCGPRRLGSGSLRDLLIGISVAYPSGVVAKAGGLVVKNVTGFDLMRLHHGALGTLGVIVSANFKTIPLARSEATVSAAFSTLDAAFDAADRVRAGRVRPLALEIDQTGAEWRVSVRIAGRPSTVDLLTTEARGELGGGAQTMSSEESAAWWRGYIQAQSLDRSDRVLIRAGVAPKATRKLMADIQTVLAERAVAVDLLCASPGLGSALISVPVASLTAKSLAGLQTSLLQVAAHVTILSAPPELKACVDVWGRQPETLPVMRALKAEFDPKRTINPGRLVGRL